MYEKHYGLSADPFRLSPDHGFCLRHASFSRARAYMQYALQRKEGFVVITGAPGTGKTTLIDDLLADASAANVHVARLASAQLQADDLLRMVCYAFGIMADGQDKSLLLHRLSERFGASHRVGRRPLLIVDEAQGLSHDALEELRLLTNLRSGSEPLLQIFLIGQEELREIVNSPVLEQLNQRVIASCQLTPLQPQEVGAYIRHRLEVAGWKGRPRFEAEMLPGIARFSRGVPRRINHICSRLLLHGMLEEREVLTLDDLKLVMTELESEHYVDGDVSTRVELEEFDPEDLSVLSEVPAEPQGVGARLVEAEAAREQVVSMAERRKERENRKDPETDSTSGRQGDTEQERPAPQQEAAPDAAAPDVAAESGEPVAPVDAVPGVAPKKAEPPLAGEAKGKKGDGKEKQGNQAESPSDGHPALWGLLSCLILVAALFAAVLVTAPEYQFRQLVKADTWGDQSVGRLRAGISSLTGGHWPLSESAPDNLQGLRVMSVPGGIAGSSVRMPVQVVRLQAG